MKKADVQVGRHYKAKVSGNEVPVLITGELPEGGWEARNVKTGKAIRIKSAQRLRAAMRQLDDPAKAAKRRSPEEIAAAKRSQAAVEAVVTGKRIVTKAEYEADAKGSAPAADVGPGAEKPAKAAKDAKPAPKRDTGEPDANDGEPKRMSIMSAAVKVLEERDPADGPLTCPQMLERMTAKGYWSPARGGKTPANTLYAAILREINTKGEASRFDKVERGKFSLSLKR
jgi:hypothetical protein